MLTSKLSPAYCQSTVGVEDAVGRGTYYAGELMEYGATVAGASRGPGSQLGAG